MPTAIASPAEKADSAPHNTPVARVAHMLSTPKSARSLSLDPELLRAYAAGSAPNSLRALYTQVATSTISSTQSPLDRLTLEVVPPG